MSREQLVYLTYGDMDSPVFETQVIGFCDFVEKELEIDTLLVSFVPLRLYMSQKKKLSRYGRPVKVYPVVNRWQGRKWYSRFNARLVAGLGGKSVMTRNPIASHLTAALKEKGWRSFYDARGCQYVELKEFSDASEAEIEEMKRCEVQSFRQADWVFSVSKQLVDYFKDNHKYWEHTFSVIPCCYNVEHEVAETRQDLKTRLLKGKEGKIFCYAGSLGVWNFPKSFLDLLKVILSDKTNTVVILSKDISKLEKHRFLQNNEQVILKSVGVKEVKEYVSISDYTILLRKKAVTNQVASPSKFAEYLANGAQVIISPAVGDLSEFVQQKGCGLVYKNKNDNERILALTKTSDEQRLKNKALADDYFQRASVYNKTKYRNLQTIHGGHYND